MSGVCMQAQIAEDKSTTDELLDSILPAEARSLAKTQAKMMQQMQETRARLAELEDNSPVGAGCLYNSPALGFA